MYLDSAPDAKSKLEVIFEKKVAEESLKPLFSVIQGLMRFKPEDRISASQALKLVRAIRRQSNEIDDDEEGNKNEEA
jgi:serine/threonine-protein kinase SRPK3